MFNRTYRYFNCKPLYGFGYGLSYTTFQYKPENIPATIKKGQNLNINTRITNTGKMDGDEVAQLYVENMDGRIKTPFKSLKCFQRISLMASESKVIHFVLSQDDLSYVDQFGQSQPFLGKVKIFVGSNQPDE